MVSCLVLAAGSSRRFGSPKALVNIGDQKLIAYLLNKLIQSKLSEIIVILGHESEQIQPHVLNHKKIQIVHNKDHKFGQTSSVQTGLRLISKNIQGVMILPVDCPFVSVAAIDLLVDYFQTHKSHILIPTYQGLNGHPPIFHRALKTEIQNLPYSCGLNSIIQNNQERVEKIEINDPGIKQTFNTPDELAAILINLTE